VDKKSESSVPKAEAVGTKTGGSAGAASGGAVGGSGDNLFGVFHEHIHDCFFSVWDQPTSIAGTANFVTGLRIKIESDGRISDFTVVRSSGNVVMDESVMAAARRVLKVDPPPAGLLSGGAYQVTINFELE
jgi:TonB family protein